MEKEKQVAIVLGGTNPHIELIKNLKTRGYHVILVDYLKAPPAKMFADEHIQESSLDHKAVQRIAREKKAACVLALCVDQANFVAACVSEELGLPAPYGYSIFEQSANKIKMKEKLVKAKIRTSPFQVLHSLNQLNDVRLKYPLVVKPADCGGSKGVRKVSNREELKCAAEEAFNLTQRDSILVEDFCEGLEVSADCFIQNGQAKVLMFREKYIHSHNTGTVLASYASVSPVLLSTGAETEISHAIQSIADNFNLETTPLLVQFIVNEDRASVLEFAPRIGGGLNFRTIPLKTGIDIIQASVNAWLGKSVELNECLYNGYVSTNHVYALPGLFGEVRNYQRLLRDEVITEIYIHKARNAIIGKSMSSSDRVASFIVKADTKQELFNKMDLAFDTLDVLDINGKSVLHREVGFLKR